MIDPLILGDNPLYGINHRGESDTQRAMTLDTMMRLFKCARASGAGGVMLSSHENVPELMKRLVRESELKDFRVYAQIPYLMSYVSQVTRHGIPGTVSRMLASERGFETLGSMLSGGFALIKKNYRDLVVSFLDLEMAKFQPVTPAAVFLHNGIVDLAVGLGMDDFLMFWHETVRERYKTVPGFGTLNPVLALAALKRAGVPHPLVMAPFNALGFHMNPSRKACEHLLADRGFTLLAMNVLASGALPPRAAFDYLKKFDAIRSVVLGASSEAHIVETFLQAKESLCEHSGI